ncbi:hypothetical protein [Nodosilinea sp. FACHB-13]|uniref:hypothetical protein n=1 Tax=Cyanophyceae TaxID=3028117 RepID=UPI00168967C0|nr:hypothetical protein [Nodosilinea sp. FACHB-13]MBD2109267.1 hypothetical protein [Nodosilinea sp. FACHB-13]
MPSLRTTLLVDSVVCFIYGAVLTIAARLLSTVFMNTTVSLLGYSTEEALRILGLCVLGIGLYVCVVGYTKQITSIAVWLVIGAVAVFGFMIFELIGLRSLQRNRIDLIRGDLSIELQSLDSD